MTPGRRVRWFGDRLRALPVGDLWLLGLAFAALGMFRVLLQVVPVTRLLGWKSRPLLASRHPEAAKLARVRWAVLVVVRRSPVRFVCFPQCLAGAWMLRRWGIASRLHYGVTRTGGRLETHTWLESGGEIVLGGEESVRFEEVAVY